LQQGIPKMIMITIQDRIKYPPLPFTDFTTLYLILGGAKYS
jgi:hypothetical protein